MSESSESASKIKDGVLEGSPIERAQELMGQLPALLGELITASTHMKSLKALRDLPETPALNTTGDYLQNIYDDEHTKYLAKKTAMEELITELEQTGHSYAVQDAREKLKTLD